MGSTRSSLREAFSLLPRSKVDATAGPVIPIDPRHKVVIRNPDTQWITKPVHKHRLISAGRKSPGLGKGHLSLHKIGGSSRTAWRRHNTLQPELHRYS
ncbi:hypothetical protein Celaphus_00001753 [Cervus elaphus hippelaphus]|uniref:Ribosomal protein L15 n=1 Tax=Cervus elaphus hippelaphus TaxID=46360 RepID=A0A212CGH9_CEREH|nr:hypothetical protein Celaphus_00001753 [Cervus elaphus hippelaphus]